MNHCIIFLKAAGGAVVFLFALLLGAVPSQALASTFVYSFNVPGTLAEAGSMTESSSPYWWLNSGGQLRIGGYTGETVQGDLSLLSPLRLLYASANPEDTDNGQHPQNIFRMLTKSTWGDASIQNSFLIMDDNWSESPNRNGSNGLLLMSRYAAGGETLYYAGIRVDGTAVIKKKYNGTYYTMAQKEVFPGTYVDGGKTNLLPHREWVHLRAVTDTNADGTVAVTLYMKRVGETSWTEILSATDDGKRYGGTPVIESGYAGIRTDFMDVRFDSFRIDSL